MFEAIRMDVQRYGQQRHENNVLACVRALYSHPAFWGVLWYRLSHEAWSHRHNLFQGLWYFFLRLLYPLVRIQSGLELAASATVGPGLWVGHFGPTVIHPHACIGAHATLMQGVTIGEDKRRVPILGDHVSVGVGAIVVGPVRIGDGAVIGAGAVVTHDVPAYHLAVGVPARVSPLRKAAADAADASSAAHI